MSKQKWARRVVVGLCGVGSALLPLGQVTASTFPGKNGRLIYTDIANYPHYQLMTVKPDGSSMATVGTASSNERYPSYSPDGTKITYTQNVSGVNHIFIAKADGSNAVQLTSGSSANIMSSFSPDGTKIVYSHQGIPYYDIYSMNIDGTNQTHLLSPGDNCFNASYSPDGSKILFESSYSGGDDEILVMNADGSNVVNLTNNSQHDIDPRWSPDGSKISYATLGLGLGTHYQIMTMDADGSNNTALTSDANEHYTPVFSPDGTKIAYTVYITSGMDLYTMNANGSSQTRITTTEGGDWHPDWQPLTLGPTAVSNANPTVTVNAGTASVDIAALFSDPYGEGIDKSTVSVTHTPTKGSTTVNPATGVITYTQTSTASRRFWSSVASFFFPKALAATATDSFTYRVCSLSNSSLCSSGTITVNLASSNGPIAPSTGYGQPPASTLPIAVLYASLCTIAWGLRFLIRRKRGRPICL